MYGDKDTDPGLVYLSVDSIFSTMKGSLGNHFLVRFSYVEIYNKKMNDLINPEIKCLSKSGIEVKGATEVICSSREQVYDIIKESETIRRALAPYHVIFT